MANHISLDDIISEYMKLIIKYCLPRMNYNYYDSEDAAQEVMITLYKNWNRLEKKEDMQQWLYRVADNKIKKHFTKKTKESKRLPTDYIEDLPEYEKPYKNDDENMRMSETDLLINNINEIRSRLSEEDQELFDYRYQEKLTLKEIAQIKKIPYTTLHDKFDKLEEIIRELIKELLYIE